MVLDQYMLLILLSLLLVSFLFSSVGHGGASGYLAVLSLSSIPVIIIKPTALVLNIFVSLISFLLYYKQGYFKWKLFYPFIILSIPTAFIGGQIKLELPIYKTVLGVVLLFAVAKIFMNKKADYQTKEISIPLALLFGAIIGLLSGVLGIGGGILLSPVLLLFRWTTIKEAAPISALFIFLNSISGLLGFYADHSSLPKETLTFVPVALIGGTIGSYYGSKKYSNAVLQKILVVVLCIAIAKLIFH
jgi:uncharacterized protein